MALALHLALGASAQPASPKLLFSGSLPDMITEASGATLLKGLPNDQLLLIGDKDLSVTVIDNTTACFNNRQFTKHTRSLNGDLEESLKVNDLEDAAWDAKRRAAFLIGSGSKNSSNERKDKREKLVRLSFDKTGKVSGQEVPDFKDQVVAAFPQLKGSVESDAGAGGPGGTFNIEGAAFLPDGKLLLGFRSPTHVKQVGNSGDAIVATLTNPHQIFDSDAAPKFGKSLQYLNLGGQGVRGFFYDAQRRGCWIVSGASANAKAVHREGWKLWFWNLKSQPVEKPVAKNPLKNAEGVCRMNFHGKPGLLVIEDNGKDGCHYALMALPR